jgi:ectoine hydroxylase-related dioxygenase (phytanoyl-CoA dioxygenase family)
VPLPIADFEENGAAVLEGLIGPDEVQALIAEIESLLLREPALPPHAFRDAARKVPRIAVLAKSRVLNDLAENALGSPVRLIQAIYFDKTPESNWKVAWHQDLAVPAALKAEASGFGPWSLKEGIPYVQPPAEALGRMVIIRLHLDDCGPENGPLRVLAGSHSWGRLRDEDVAATVSGKEGVACTVGAGGAVLMKPLTLHASSSALKPGHRRVVHLEYATGDLAPSLDWFKALD